MMLTERFEWGRLATCKLKVSIDVIEPYLEHVGSIA
jgi:hypothetical protein